MIFQVYLTILFLSAFSIATPLVQNQATCVNITIPVPIYSFNAALPVISSLEVSLIGLVSYLNSVAEVTFSYLVSGTFNTAATYCEPQVSDPSRENTLQLLVHGATYTKECM